jgi:hypothetical protein
MIAPEETDVTILGNGRWVVLVLSLLYAYGCASSTTKEDPADDDDTTSTSSSGTGGQGGAGGGTGSPCNVPGDCPGVDTACSHRTCDSGTCGIDYAALGMACNFDGGKLCDGQGNCVQCVAVADCPGETCVDNQCVPKKALGEACDADDECLNGNCPPQDGVCCDVPCLAECEACLLAKTGSPDGTCGPVTPAADPDSECADQGAASCGVDATGCDGNATSPACNLYPNGTECLAGTCANGQQTGANLCDGSGTCVAGSVSACAPYVCGSTSCLTACQNSGDCITNYTCNAPVCSGGTTVVNYGNDQEFTENSSHGANYLLGSLINVPVASTLTHLAVITKGNAANMKLALYTSAGGDPGTLVAQTPSTAMTTGTMELAVTNVALPAGDYWFMGVYSTSASIGYDTSQSAAVVKYVSHSFSSALPSTFPAPQTYTGQRFNYYIKVTQ